MNNLFNISPLAFFDVLNFLQQAQANQEVMQYQNGFGLDKSFATRNQNRQNQTAKLFSKYFKPSLEAYIQTPYRAQSTNASQDQPLSFVQTFTRDSMPTPADAFKLMGYRKQLTAEDGERVKQMIRDSLAYAAKSQTSFSEPSDLFKVSSTGIVQGQVHQNDTIMDPTAAPPQLTEISDRVKTILGEILPHVDLKQSLAMFNMAYGRGGNGEDNITINSAFSKTPLIQVAQAIAYSTNPRKRLVFDAAARQIKYQSQLPAAVSTMFSPYDTAKKIAQQHKFLKVNAMQIKKDTARRFGILLQ